MNSVVSFHFTSAVIRHSKKAFKPPKALLSVAIPPRLFYSPTLTTSESSSRLGCFLVFRKNHSFSENLFNFWLTFRLIDSLQGRGESCDWGLNSDLNNPRMFLVSLGFGVRSSGEDTPLNQADFPKSSRKQSSESFKCSNSDIILQFWKATTLKHCHIQHEWTLTLKIAELAPL